MPTKSAYDERAASSFPQVGDLAVSRHPDRAPKIIIRVEALQDATVTGLVLFSEDKGTHAFNSYTWHQSAFEKYIGSITLTSS